MLCGCAGPASSAHALVAELARGVLERLPAARGRRPRERASGTTYMRLISQTAVLEAAHAADRDRALVLVADEERAVRARPSRRAS